MTSYVSPAAWPTAPGWPAPTTLADLGITPDQNRPPIRGYQECYYGDPWSWAERHAMLESAGALDYTHYVYGPANDPHTGSSWSQPYTPQELAEFSRLVEHASSLGMTVVWRVSPSAPLNPADAIRFNDEGAQRLITRIHDITTTGITTILIAFDDIEHAIHPDDRQRFGADAVAVAQGWLIEQVVDALPNVQIVVCPTLYWGDPGSPYRAALIGALPANTSVVWTGSEVVAPFITQQEASAILAEYERPLWLWDNYPVNDWGKDIFESQRPQRIYLGAPHGREPALRSEVSAYLWNLSPGPAACLGPLVGGAAWLAGVPEKSLDAVVDQWYHRLDPTGALARVAHCLQVSATDPHSAEELVATVWQTLLQVDTGSATTITFTTCRAAAATVQRALEGLGDSAVRDAITPWLQRLTLEAEAVGAACDVLDGHVSRDRTVFVAGATKLRPLLEAMRATNQVEVLGGAGRALITRAVVAMGTTAPQPRL